MTPKEKALELYWEYKEICKNWLDARECALITVNEIIKANPIVPLEFMLESEALDAANEYWTEVKQEIEKL